MEDEEHVVFECPSFECVRNKYRDLFLEQTKLIKFMNTKKQGKLASFLWNLMWEQKSMNNSNITDIINLYPIVTVSGNGQASPVARR